jgi:3-hydroxybutyryl-CoA dehydrogenase
MLLAESGDQVEPLVGPGVEIDEHGVDVGDGVADDQRACPSHALHCDLQLAGEHEVVAHQGHGTWLWHELIIGVREATTSRQTALRDKPQRESRVMQISTVGIVGAGLMGSGIAEICARQGLRTLVAEADEAQLAAGRRRVAASLHRARERGKLSAEEVEQILQELRFTVDLDEFAECDICIEAIVEHLPAKTDLFARLDRIAPRHAILATNTSSLPIIEIARVTSRPERVIGTHFFNPAPVMKLLEVVRSIVTSAETLDETREFGELLGKHIIVAQDRGGFIVNLLLIPFLTHAARLYESGFATREDIDQGMRLGCGHPMGPLELLDYIGLDTALFVCDSLYEEYANADYAPPPLLRRMVAAGYLGRKSGRGFYEYEGSPDG